MTTGPLDQRNKLDILDLVLFGILFIFVIVGVAATMLWLESWLGWTGPKS
jgi:hypothetical protein